jgi:hypothetical protein
MVHGLGEPDLFQGAPAVLSERAARCGNDDSLDLFAVYPSEELLKR